MATADQIRNLVFLGCFTCLTFAVGAISAFGFVYATPLLVATILYAGYLVYLQIKHDTKKEIQSQD